MATTAGTTTTFITTVATDISEIIILNTETILTLTTFTQAPCMVAAMAAMVATAQE